MMRSLKSGFVGAVRRAEERLDRLRYGLRRRLGRMGPAAILPYRGHGTERDLYLTGRVLKRRDIKRPTETDSTWQNLYMMIRRFGSGEIPGVRLRARFQEAEQEVTTDREGYFALHLRPAGALPADRVWHEVDLVLPDRRRRAAPGSGEVRATGYVLVPPIESDFGIISDIDDTVLQTGAVSLLRMLRTTMLGNALTRLPFEGVAAFYHALAHGPSGTGQNPLFYVSSSPWNLYDFLTDFLQLNGIPLGPIFLRDYGIDAEKFIASPHHEHKLRRIEEVLATHPDLPFILIGDSGQDDPEIYRQVVQDFPGRVEAVYVRDVTTPARDAVVHAIAREVEAAGVPMCLVPDSVAAAQDAAERGFIHPDALPDIRAEKAKDREGGWGKGDG